MGDQPCPYGRLENHRQRAVAPHDRATRPAPDKARNPFLHRHMVDLRQWPIAPLWNHVSPQDRQRALGRPRLNLPAVQPPDRERAKEETTRVRVHIGAPTRRRLDLGKKTARLAPSRKGLRALTARRLTPTSPETAGRGLTDKAHLSGPFSRGSRPGSSDRMMSSSQVEGSCILVLESVEPGVETPLGHQPSAAGLDGRNCAFANQGVSPAQERGRACRPPPERCRPPAPA